VCKDRHDDSLTANDIPVFLYYYGNGPFLTSFEREREREREREKKTLMLRIASTSAFWAALRVAPYRSLSFFIYARGFLSRQADRRDVEVVSSLVR